MAVASATSTGLLVRVLLLALVLSRITAERVYPYLATADSYERLTLAGEPTRLAVILDRRNVGGRRRYLEGVPDVLAILFHGGATVAAYHVVLVAAATNYITFHLLFL